MIAEKLKNLVVVKGGKRLPKGAGYSDVETQHPYIRVCDFKLNSIKTDDLKYISHEIHTKISRYIIDHEDVFISIAGTIGLAGIIPESLSGANLTENAAKLVIEDKNKLNKKYLSWILNTDGQNQIKQATKATSQPKLALFRIEDIKIPLPPLAEQRRIAAILDKADAIRRKQQQAIDLCDHFLKALFIDMFGDPVTNPKDWEVKKLGDFLSLKPTIGTIQPVSDEGTHKVVRVGEIGSRQVNLEACKNIIPTEKEYERSLLDEGDLILARAIGSEKLLGKASLFDGEEENVFFDSHVMRIRCDQKKLVPLFVYWWLSTDGGRALFMKRAGRTAVQFNINGKQFCLIDIAVPPLDLQNKFAEIVKKTEVKKAKMQKSLDRLNDNFNALSQKAFKGEL